MFDDYVIVDKTELKVDNVNNNSLKFFNSNTYILTIIKSYKNKNKTKQNIYNQWSVDFPRQVIKIGDMKATDVQFIEFATAHKTTVSLLLFMFTTQAMFFYPFETMCKLYNTDKVTVLDAGKYKTVQYVKHGEFIIINFNLIVNLFDVAKEHIVNSLSVDMRIDLDYSTGRISKYGVLSWNKIEK